MHRFFSMLAEASRARFSLVFRRFSLTQSLSPIKVTRLVNKMAVARTIIKFSAVRSWRTIAILSAVALVTTTVNAQFTKDPSYPDDCKQNSDNPSSAYECKRINPDEAPYKNQWRSRIANGFPDNTYFDAFTDSPEEGRDLQLVAINAEQVRLQADYEAKGFNGIGYIYRFIIDPMNPQCTPPYVDENWSFSPDISRRSVTSYCRVQQIDSRFAPGAPQYLINNITLYASKIANCESGWHPRGAGPKDSIGRFISYPHVCYRDETSKELGERCTKCGNPINFATGNKYESESDYVGTGSMPLQILRYYNSASRQNQIEIGNNWRLDYDRRLKVEGANSVWVTRPDGKIYYFLLINGQWTPDSEVNDRIAPVVDSTNNIVGWQYSDARTLNIEGYSSAGLLQTITDRAGNITKLQYSDALTPATIAPRPNMLVQVTDPFGRSLGLTYRTDSRLASIVDPSGGSYAFGYDSIGNLASVTRPDGAVRFYLYNEPAFNAAALNTWALTGIIDENNSRLSIYKYSADGRAYSTELASGIYKFTIGGGPTVTDPLGFTKSYLLGGINQVRYPYNTDQPCASTGCTGTQTEIRRYDANANLVTFIDLRGVMTLRTFDTVRNLETSRREAANSPVERTINTTWHPTFRLPATVTEPVTGGSKVTTNSYDNNGNLSQRQVTSPVGTRTLNWTYDQYGRVLTATDARGNTSVNTYYPNTAAQNATLANSRGMLASVTNALGHTMTMTAYNPHGQVLSMTDANGLTSTMSYDARQRLISRTVGSETTTYTYDGVGQLTQVTLPDFSTLNYRYDGAHRLVQIQDGLGNKMVYTLDAMGNRVKETAGDPMGALVRTRSRVYDALNRLQQDIGGANPAAQITQYAYDENGNQVAMTDPLSRTTRQNYDALNRLMQVVDPFNGSTAPTQYAYDAQDNLTQITDPKNLSTAYTYNGFNELVRQTSPDTGTTTFSYDNGGNLVTKADARGVTATYRYDALNRVTTINYPALGSAPSETVLYTYDNCGNGKGRLCAVMDKTGLTTFSYDIRGRIIAKTQTLNGAFTNPAQTVAYSYNAAGQMDAMTLPSGKVVAYTYVNNRVTGVTYDGKPVIKNADYEPFGPIGEWTWGNDTTGSGGTLVNKHVRYFDLDGRTTKIESGNTIDPAIIVYDAASRITDLQRLTTTNGTPAVDPAKSISYAYDSLDRLTGVTPNAGNVTATQRFSYDAVGNRLSNTIAGSVTNYTYSNTSHRLAGLTGAITQSFSYDANGNRLSGAASGPNQNWTYGGDNRPTAISMGGSTPVSVQSGINALGQRVLKTVNSSSQSNSSITRFVYDEAGRLIGEYDSRGRPIEETLWLNDLPVAVIK